MLMGVRALLLPLIAGSFSDFCHNVDRYTFVGFACNGNARALFLSCSFLCHVLRQLFGDDVLEGGGEAKTRKSTVVAVTDCEFAVLDAPDYGDVRDRGLSQMTLDDKCNFLK